MIPRSALLSTNNHLIKKKEIEGGDGLFFVGHYNYFYYLQCAYLLNVCLSGLLSFAIMNVVITDLFFNSIKLLTWLVLNYSALQGFRCDDRNNTVDCLH